MMNTSAYVLARIRAEPGFFTAVATEITPWIQRIPDVRAALLANALNPKLENQWEWMKRYAEMTGQDFLPD